MGAVPVGRIFWHQHSGWAAACQRKWGSLSRTKSWTTFEKHRKRHISLNVPRIWPHLKLNFKGGLFFGPNWSESYWESFSEFVIIFMWKLAIFGLKVPPQSRDNKLSYFGAGTDNQMQQLLQKINSLHMSVTIYWLDHTTMLNACAEAHAFASLTQWKSS